MRVAPRPWLGLIAVAAYLAVIVFVQGTSGIPYTELASSARTLWRDGALSIALAGLVVAGLATWWGWWRPALVERPTSARRWTVVAPILLLVLALSNLLVTDWSQLGADFIIAGLAVGVLVGFGEELTVRGLLVVGLRARLREVAVWLTTCLVFGLMHGVNVLLGAAVGGTAIQVLSAAAQGSSFYILRRVTGSLVWAMALHGLWDFSVFASSASEASPVVALLALPVAALAVVFGFFATKSPSPTQPPRRQGDG